LKADKLNTALKMTSNQTLERESRAAAQRARRTNQSPEQRAAANVRQRADQRARLQLMQGKES
jgi:hypothetical protein